MWLHESEQLLKINHDLMEIAEEIDDEEMVPERYHSSMAAVLSELDSNTLRDAASVLHRLSMNAKYPKLDALKSNYVNFNKEARNG
jgi:hypothetical protein